MVQKYKSVKLVENTISFFKDIHLLLYLCHIPKYVGTPIDEFLYKNLHFNAQIQWGKKDLKSFLTNSIFTHTEHAKGL